MSKLAIVHVGGVPRRAIIPDFDEALADGTHPLEENEEQIIITLEEFSSVGNSISAAMKKFR